MNSLSPWDFKARIDGPSPSIGEGLSRPEKGAKTRTYRLLVRQQTLGPMKVGLKAESPKHALRYANARWPDAAIELLK